VVVGIALLLTGSVGAIALVAAFLVGLGLGAEADIIAFLISRYFGLRAFGSAYGSSWGSFVMAGAVGTLLMGACFDLTHSYTIALAGFLIIALIAAGLMTRLGPYRFGVEQSHESRPLSQARAGSHA
jgi:hypothetical protein